MSLRSQWAAAPGKVEGGLWGVSVSGITFGGGREERPGVGGVHADFFLPECGPGVWGLWKLLGLGKSVQGRWVRNGWPVHTQLEVSLILVPLLRR